MLPNLPQSVEGRIPSEEELAYKAANGRHYLTDIGVILHEFPTHGIYESRSDLKAMVGNVRHDVALLGYDVVDSSHELDGLVHCLEFTLQWARCVRETRTSNTMQVFRRTPENSAAMLMLQRMEHLRNQCSEFAPVALVILVRDDQMIVTRDRVPEQDALERMVIELARRPLNTTVSPEDDETPLLPEPSPNMPQPLFKQQIRAIQDLLSSISKQAALEPVPPTNPDGCEPDVHTEESVHSNPLPVNCVDALVNSMKVASL